MKIGGLLKCSLIDYPGQIAAVVFTQGCNLRCPYCHNVELVLPEYFQDSISEADVFRFLEKRTRQLGGVVVTGGEPALQEDLLPFCLRVKQLGYLVKLDTNGTYPDVLVKLFAQNVIDYVAMDVKAPFDKYPQITKVAGMQEQIKKSIDLIVHSGIAHQFRTTIVKDFLNEDDIRAIAEMVKGAQHYRLQNFTRQTAVLDDQLKEADQTIDKLEFETWKARYEW